MGMQTDVYASQAATTDGQLVDQANNAIGRTRVKAILIVPDTTAGSVEFRDGGISGATKLTVETKASSTNTNYMLLPGEGMLFSNDIYVAVTDVVSVMVFYG